MSIRKQKVMVKYYLKMDIS